MGVEYKHFLIPEDPTFIATKNAVIHIDQVMEKWGLKTGEPEIWDIEPRKPVLLTDVALNNLTIGHGLAIRYPMSIGPSTENIMGPWEDRGPGRSYYMGGFFQVTLITGTDYKIQPSSDIQDIEVENTAADSIYLEVDSDVFTTLFQFKFYQGTCLGTATTLPPKVSINCTWKELSIALPYYCGYWRTALIIDCHKCLPENNMTHHQINNKDFVKDIETALGSRFFELGEIY